MYKPAITNAKEWLTSSKVTVTVCIATVIMHTKLGDFVLCNIIHSSHVTEGQADYRIPTVAVGGEMEN